ncbi:MAG: glycosyltransferase [Bacteriovoracaceae bacterium]|nr:glycosyltransferase [Bacteroidota bacterium]
MKPSITLVIAVYNTVDALRYIFVALSRQSFRDFEVIIADDGSGYGIAAVVNDAKQRYSFTIKHLWHADKGWRKNTMLNYAIHASSSEYLVFIDGDCIPAEHFLEDHYTHREHGKVLLGRRVEHGKRWAESLTMDKITTGVFERYSITDLLDALSGASARLEHGIRITNPFLRSLTEKSSGMLGSNFSTFRDHLIAVNGFDELYTGPGFGEDTDIFYRLNLIGVSGKSLRNLAVQYHLWHPLTRVSDKNRLRFEQMMVSKTSKCKNGLVRLR